MPSRAGIRGCSWPCRQLSFSEGGHGAWGKPDDGQHGGGGGGMGFCPASASGRFCARSRGHTPLLCWPALALSLSLSTGHLRPRSGTAPPPLPHGHWHYAIGQSRDTLVLSSAPGGALLTQDGALWGLSSLHGQPTWGHGETPTGLAVPGPVGSPGGYSLLWSAQSSGELDSGHEERGMWTCPESLTSGRDHIRPSPPAPRGLVAAPRCLCRSPCST